VHVAISRALPALPPAAGNARRTEMKVDIRPSPVWGGIIAVLGLVLGFFLLPYTPEILRASLSGALAGGFGVAAASRIWPGLPLRQILRWLGAIVVYGVAIGLAGAAGGWLLG
jgi:hypothetical protein